MPIILVILQSKHLIIHHLTFIIMKKVYLVYVSLFYTDSSRTVILLNAFASAKKAQVYADYKSLSIEREGAAGVFGIGVESAFIRLDAEAICTVDWSYDLKMLEDETF